jgi:hypothetical protein
VKLVRNQPANHLKIKIAVTLLIDGGTNKSKKSSQGVLKETFYETQVAANCFQTSLDASSILSQHFLGLILHNEPFFLHNAMQFKSLGIGRAKS